MNLKPKEEIQFYDLYHLREAWFEVRRKRAQGGIDGVSVDEFDQHADKYLRQLGEELQSNAYVPEPYQRIYMRQPGSSPRPLGLPTVKDKVVQMAVRNAIEPIFNAIFKDCSYAYRPGKGHRKAIRRVEHYLGTHNVWVTTCDIDKFFDSLDHQILLSLLEEKIKDQRILRLITLWLKIGIVHHEEYREIDKGVPQGGIISPLLSNVYLHSFDAHLLNHQFNLVRYADNFIILQRSHGEAEKAHDVGRNFLETNLKLKLNPIERKVWHVKSGFVFLGIEFRGYSRTIAAEKFRKAELKIKNIFEKGCKRKLHDVIEELNESILSWRYYYGAGHTKKQFQILEDQIQTGLVKLVQEKLSKKEIKSKQEAEQTLNRLKTLLDKRFSERVRFIKSILRGQLPQSRKHKKKPATTKQDKPPWSESKRPPKKDAAKEGKEVSPAAIKRQITRKKKKYQRRKAEITDLVISSSYCQIGKLYQRIVVRKRGSIIQQVPHMQLKHIMIIGDGISLSSDVIRLCGKAKIPLDFVDFKGQPVARLANPDFPRLEVGLAQLQAFDNGKARTLAKTVVEAKVRNQLNLIKYFHKYRKEVDEEFDRIFSEEEKRIESYLDELDELKGKWSLAENRGKLFAIEGRAASSYWLLIRELIKDEVLFDSRVRQGATDLFNCLLNYGYGILYSRVWGAVLRAGLNPMISYLHTDQPKKPTLVFDLIEEFRPQAVDRAIVSMIGRGEALTMNGKFLDQVTRRKIVQNVLERLNMPIRFRKKELSLMQIMNYQARALVRFLMGKEKRYKPFIGKW